VKLTVDDLEALAGFLGGLAELTASTGVEAFAYDRAYVVLPSQETVQVNSLTDEAGTVTYVVDEDG
jgi:hypothetical protein